MDVTRRRVAVVDPHAVPVVGLLGPARASLHRWPTPMIVHATNHAAVPPVHGDQRLVVTVHDLAFERFPELFPRNWRWLYRAGLRAAVKRADAILVPSQSTGRRSDRRRRRSRASRVHVTPLGARRSSTGRGSGTGGSARLGVTPPYVLVGRERSSRARTWCGWCARTGRSLREVAAHHSCWRRTRMAIGCVGRRARDGAGPGRVVCRTGSRPASLDVLYRGADVFAYPSLYEGLRPAGRWRRCRAACRRSRRTRRRSPRSPATPPSWWTPTDVSEIAGGTRSRADGAGARRRSSTARSAARRDLHLGGDRPRYARRVPPADGRPTS